METYSGRYAKERWWAVTPRGYTWLSVISTFILVGIAFIYAPRNTPFWVFETQDVVNLIMSLLLISLFIERANSIIVIAWRERERQEKRLWRDRLNRDLERNEKEPDSVEKVEVRNLIQEDIDELEDLLKVFAAQTKTIALLTALGLGILLAVIGVRVIEPLVDAAVFKSLSPLHSKLFITVDVFVTGAVLGGGSDGIYRILDLFLSSVDKQREKVKRAKVDK